MSFGSVKGAALQLSLKDVLIWLPHMFVYPIFSSLLVLRTGICFSLHYVNVSVLIKFLQKTSVFTLFIISSP